MYRFSLGNKGGGVLYNYIGTTVQEPQLLKEVTALVSPAKQHFFSALCQNFGFGASNENIYPLT